MLQITDDMSIVKSSDTAVVAFTATWCGPCKQLKPHFAKAAVKDNKTDYFVIDIDKIDNKYLEEYSIKGVPAVFGNEKWNLYLAS
jgi:thiol-disulfide isomerase/thioredoxin